MKTLLLFLVLLISDFVFSQEKDSCELYIPNAISMNCDTGEDWQFKCVSNCTPYSFEIEIYSRWGEEKFASSDFDDIWDASKEPQGVYVYKLKIVWREGEEAIEKTGQVSVIK